MWVLQDYNIHVFHIVVIRDNDELDNNVHDEDDCDAWDLQTNSVGIARSADH